jgi:hypothetical protein
VAHHAERRDDRTDREREQRRRDDQRPLLGRASSVASAAGTRARAPTGDRRTSARARP